MHPEPDYNRLLTALRGGQPDRVPLLELIVDPEMREACLGRPIRSIQDEIAFWLGAGYDCFAVYPGSPTMWFFLDEQRADTIITDAHTSSGRRRWASEGKGLILDWADLERHPVPSIDEIDFSFFDAAGPALPPGMGLIGAWGDIFTYAWEAMGFEQFSYALHERADFVAHLFDALGRLALQIVERLLSYDAVKAIWYSDDIAYRSGFLVSPVVYRHHLFPWMKQMGELCLRANRPFLFHSDGMLWEVLNDLIESGVSALHPIEPVSMDIHQVKQRYGHRLAIVGNVEVDTLARGTPEQVRDQVRWLLREIAPGGGYCLGSSNTVPSYARLDNYRAMLDAAWEMGRYPLDVGSDR